MNRRIVKLIALLCALILTLAACSGKTPAATEAPATEASATEAPAAATEAPAAEVVAQAETAEETAAVDGLTIPLSSLTEQPLFIDCKQDGTAMQLIALIDGEGAPQLAYNTCQVCAGSPYAYFEYQNGVLVCQNCGNRFALSAVGKASGGCNPKPVTGYEKDGAQLIVSEEALAQASAAFKNWKAF